MRLACAFGLLALLLATAANAAPAFRSSADVGPGDLPRVEVVSTDDSGVDLVFDLPTLAVEELSVGGQSYQVVAIPGGGLEGSEGSPGIPSFTRLVSIPDGAGVTVRAVAEGEEELSGFHLMPVQADEGKTFSYDAAAYTREGYGSAAAATVGEPAVCRDMRVVPVTFQPVQYDPVRGTLRVAARLHVEVKFEGRNSLNDRVVHRSTIAPSFDQLYRELVVNYSGPPQGMSVVPGTYLVICPNDPSVITHLQPLLDWRNRKGTPVYLATTAETGTTKESIKAFIQSAYNNWENPPEYICLAGDAGGTYNIPTWHENLSGYNGEGDHPYVQLAGGDVLADAHIGRLTFRTLDQLDIIVAKSVNYESTPYTQDTTWYRRACVAGDPSISELSVVQVQQWIKVRLRELGYTQIDTVFSGNFVTQMATALNRGDTMFSYRGYIGMSGWGNSNTDVLSNGWKMPFVVTITCDTGSFERDNSARSEEFLRAGTLGPPFVARAGIGAVGTATSGTHTKFNNCVHYGIFYGLLYANQTTLGAALTRGKYEMYLNYAGPDPNHVVIWSYWNNLMGDPAVDCWTDEPAPMSVSHPATIAVGANSFVVSALDDAMAPVSGAQVCLSKGTETYAVGYTDSQGQLELPINAATAGNMLVTVTKHNAMPYMATVPVAVQARYVSYASSSIDDGNGAGTVGNRDGLVNPGETIGLQVQLENFGTETAAGVSATITTEDPYATIVTGTQSFGDIAASGTAWSAGSYVVAVSNACPHNHQIRLGVDASSGADVWHSLIDLNVDSADLVSMAYTLYNFGGNGKVDPGETGQVSVILKNFGTVAADTPTASLLSMSQFVDIPDGQATYPSIAAGVTGENVSDPFTIHAAPETYQGYTATLQLLLTFSGGARDTTYVHIPIGNRSSDDPVGPDGYGYYAFDDTDTTYPEAPTYNWVEADPTYGGSGTEIVLGDNGNEQDKSRTVDIPFTFSYYGTPFTRATICSNGWMSMGSTYLSEYRNWSIPGAGGPDGMLAAFWDDLYQVGGGKVVQWYDAANHRWIVEWSRMRNYATGATETFEIILLDPTFYSTDTGDGEIIYQYDTVNNGDFDDGYATVGIENPENNDGILYTYFNRYTMGAATLATGRAIHFVPVREHLAGQVRGTVRNETGGGTPVPNATVTVLENGHEFQAGPDGTYIGAEQTGTYTLRASHPSFAPDTVSSVQVQSGQATQVDFSLRDIVGPAIQHTPLVTTNDQTGPYPVAATVTDYSPLSQAVVYYRTNGGSFTSTPLVPQGGSSYIGQIPGQPWRTAVEYYLYTSDAGNNASTDPPGAPTDLHVFYVAPTVSLFSDAMEAGLPWSDSAPSDNATGGRWERCDPNATYADEFHQIMVQPENDHTPGGVDCWITGNSPVGANQAANDVDGGRTTLTTPTLNLEVQGIVVLRYYRWFTNNTGSNGDDDAWVVQISDNNGLTWVDLENTTVSDRSWRLKEFDLSQYIQFTDQVKVRFIAQDLNLPSVVEAGVDDLTILVTGMLGADVVDGSVRRFGLYQNSPNPFNPSTTIRYSMEQAGVARLAVIDVQGRILRRLVDGVTPAGLQSVVWDGRDDAGRALPSGIYLYRLDAGTRSEVRKMILVE